MSRRKNPVTPATKPAHTPAPKAPKGAKAPKGEKADATHPGNLRVPQNVLLNRHDVATEDGKPTLAEDNKEMVILDDRNNLAVKVSLIEGVGLTPDTDGRLIFVESNVTHDIMSIESSKKHFAIRKDGLVVYCQQGPTPGPNVAYEMIDIVALIEHNNSAAGVAVDKKLAGDSQKVSDAQAAENKKAADKAAKAAKDEEKN